MTALKFAPNKAEFNGLNLITGLVLILLVALPRLWPFPTAFLAVDELVINRWTTGMTQALINGDWPQTANDTYPGVTMMWLEAAQVGIAHIWPGLGLTDTNGLSNSDADLFAALPQRRLVLALANTLLILAGFWLIRCLFNYFIAVSATILIALDPFLLTQSRVYRTEGITVGLMLLSLLLLLYYTHGQQQRRWLLTSAILAALAALTKLTSLYLLPFTVLVLFFWPLLPTKADAPPLAVSRLSQFFISARLRRLLVDILVWSLTLLVAFFLLWPALWVAPVQTLSTLYNHLLLTAGDVGVVWYQGRFFYQGQILEADPGISFYLWSLAYRTTPLLWLGFLGGILILLTRITRFGQISNPEYQNLTDQLNKLSPPILVMLTYAVSYFGLMSWGDSKVDRYLLPIFPALSIIAAVGFWLVTQTIAGWFWPPSKWYWLNWAGSIILMAGSVWSIWPHHPYYYTYWNPWLGGGESAVKRLPVGVGEGIDAIIDYLNELPQAAQLSFAGIGLHEGCRFTFVGSCLKPDQFLASDYFMVSVAARQRRQPLANLDMIIPDAQLVQTYTNDGVDYVRLYQMPAGLQHVGQRLNDYGTLSGYRFSATELGAGNLVTITLFWQNGAKGWQLDDSEFFVKLVDPIGQIQVVVPAQLNPEFTVYQPQPDQVLVFTALLNLPVDISPGYYPIAIGLRLKGTTTETWNFPLDGLSHTLTVNRGAIVAALEELPIQYRLKQRIGGSGLTLVGYTLLPGVDKLKSPLLYLYWQAETLLNENYRLVLTLQNAQRETVATWQNFLAPPLHPLTEWQAGEVVKGVLPLEIGYPLTPDVYHPVLNVLSASPEQPQPIATIPLTPLENFTLLPPQLHLQHHLEQVTFGDWLDLLGYDLNGQGNTTGGQLRLTLYWLNRRLPEMVEVQVDLFDPAGQVITQQLQPIQAPAGVSPWQQISYFDLPVSRFPDKITIVARPAGLSAWYPVQLPGQAVANQVTIDDVLSKTVVVLN
jgi:hypothetical protein